MPNRKIVLHAGFPKTGTTSIQRALYSARKSLLAKGAVLYPSLQENLTTPFATLFQENPTNHIAHKVNGATESDVDRLRGEYFRHIESEIEGSDWNALILSAEGLSNFNRRELRKLREWLLKYSTSISVIYCIRNPIPYMKSVIQQMMKGGDTLESLYESLPLPNFRGKIQCGLDIFGKKNVQIYDFDEAACNVGGLVGHFCDLIDLPQIVREEVFTHARRENESVSMEAALLLNRINHSNPMFIDGVRSKKRKGGEVGKLMQVPGAKFDIPMAVKHKIAGLVAEDIAWLNASFNTGYYENLQASLASDENPEICISDAALDYFLELLIPGRRA